ncbi:MAG: Xaa-Pro peptidase family protein [Chloroflexi bacterium]|nr:Xaa-Pro peptidase family protein [Chloroflexota bacterium]MCL5075400.1 Xaa-Pro peptidase family protein [Chloroflexota bacterium]
MRERNDLPFSMDEYRARLARVRQRLVEEELDVMIVNTQENIYYLTGYTTTGYWTYQALLLPQDGEPMMVVRHFEAPNVEAYSWLDGYVSYHDNEDPIQVLKTTLAKAKLQDKRIGVEKDCQFVTIRHFERLLAALPEAKIKDCSGLIEGSRLVKSEREIEYIRKAAEIASISMAAAIQAVREGTTENDLAIEAYRASIGNGSEYIANPFFVAAGTRSGFAHATWSGGRIQKGDVVYFELAGCVQRYHAALMRTVVVGQPSEIIDKAAQAAINAVNGAIRTMRPGIMAGEVDQAAREVVSAAGLAECFRHRTGYSIGIAYPPGWTEGHIMDLKPGDPRMLQAGMVFHLPLVLLVPSVGGIGFSETVLVTKDGCEVLTKADRSLLVR